jgi:hypothetical protein
MAIDFTGTGNLDLILNEKASFDIQLAHFEDDGTTPLNLPAGIWQMGIAKNTTDNATLLLAAGTGLTVVANTITISRLAIQNVLPAGQFYFDIRCDLADGSAIYPYAGKINIVKRITAHI